MRLVIQRVTSAEIIVNNQTVSKIGNCLVILLGIKKGDNESMTRSIAQKCAEMRIFEDNDGKFNLSAKDISAEALVISQFTLYADTTHGRRLSFTAAEEPVRARQLYENFIEHLKTNGIPVETGVFGERMQVNLQNRGPVTIIMED